MPSVAPRPAADSALRPQRPASSSKPSAEKPRHEATGVEAPPPPTFDQALESACTHKSKEPAAEAPKAAPKKPAAAKPRRDKKPDAPTADATPAELTAEPIEPQPAEASDEAPLPAEASLADDAPPEEPEAPTELLAIAPTISEDPLLPPPPMPTPAPTLPQPIPAAETPLPTHPDIPEQALSTSTLPAQPLATSSPRPIAKDPRPTLKKPDVVTPAPTPATPESRLPPDPIAPAPPEVPTEASTPAIPPRPTPTPLPAQPRDLPHTRADTPADAPADTAPQAPAPTAQPAPEAPNPALAAAPALAPLMPLPEEPPAPTPEPTATITPAHPATTHASRAESAAPAQDSPAPDPQQTFDQVVLGLRGKFDPRAGKAEIRLEPPHLGAVNVSVSLENGILTAEFRSSSDLVRGLLKENLDQLKSVLETRGVAVDRLAVADAAAPAPQGQQNSSGNAAHDGRSAGQYHQDPRGNNRRPDTAFATLLRKTSGPAQTAPVDLVA